MREEIMREASMMLAKHGKEAIAKAESYANEKHNEIRAMEHYDPEKISALEEKRNFWLSVASRINDIK